LDVTANIFDKPVSSTTAKTRGRVQAESHAYLRHSSLVLPPADRCQRTERHEAAWSIFDPALYDPAKAPCITSSGNMDVKLQNGVADQQRLQPELQPA